ncbi:hypothetical protein O4J56_20675 [Nocardiopsis sp. RSe5-2]|uniref:Pyrrolo-quinoline quinone n=1 Tax=Nocardiopsis endophytica TaxID=3018445 RepID=A0ABT4U7Y8_9ACTN|nr:hypothetical protein [Nocardiopsis endophytica]MDA2813073.1 hypothetical protein [Nocardiopsis endophytica]
MNRTTKILASVLALLLLSATAVFITARANNVSRIDREAAPEPDKSDIPEDVNSISWEWASDLIPSLREAWSTPSGAVLQISGENVDDGVIGLNTSTGEQTWHFRFPGDGKIWMSPDRDFMLIWHERSGFWPWDSSVEASTVATATGEVLATSKLNVSMDEVLSYQPDATQLTDSSLIRLSDSNDGRTFIDARDPVTYERLWSEDFTGSCGFKGYEATPGDIMTTTKDSAIVSLTCSGENGGRPLIRAYDATSGEIKWEYNFPDMQHQVTSPIRIQANNADHWIRGDNTSKIIKTEVESGLTLVDAPDGPIALSSNTGSQMFDKALHGREILAIRNITSDHIILGYTSGLSQNPSESNPEAITLRIDEQGKESQIDLPGNDPQQSPQSVIELKRAFVGVTATSESQNVVVAGKDGENETITVAEETGLSEVAAEDQPTLADESMFLRTQGALVVGRIKNGELESLVGLS